MNLVNRLKIYLEEKGITSRSLAITCGIDPSNLMKMLKNEQNISKKSIDKIIANTDINPGWLLTGEGEMLVEGKDTEGSLSSSDETGLINKVPLIPASAFAGGISGFAPDSIMLKDCEMIIPPVDGAQCAITITGDSMEPDFHNGSIAFLRLINESAFIPWGHVMVIDTEMVRLSRLFTPILMMRLIYGPRALTPNTHRYTSRKLPSSEFLGCSGHQEYSQQCNLNKLP